MAGTIPLSLTQQFDIYGKPLSGGQLFLIQAGTVATPQNGFQDTALTIALPNPITLDAAGRIPQFFLADGSIKVRLVDKSGIVQLAADSILVIGPSAGGGGGTPVDPTQLIQTGNVITRYGVGALAGYVRLNGLSIGSATSGATERANNDCQAAFNYLWNTDPNLVLAPARGASSAADWTANKQLILPDLRGRVIAGMDDMGNASAGRLNSMSSTTLGASGGEQTHILLAAELALHTHGGTTAGMNQNATHSHTSTGNGQVVASAAGGAGNFAGGPFSTPGVAITINPTNTDHSHNFLTDTGQGVGGFPHNNIQPAIVMTTYLKL